MGMGQVGQVKTALIPINTIPAHGMVAHHTHMQMVWQKSHGLSRTHSVFIARSQEGYICYDGSTISANMPPSIDPGSDQWKGGIGALLQCCSVHCTTQP